MLGAAVADDVMGLVILTVVVGIITQGKVSAGYVALTVLLAVAFLVLASWLGTRLVPLFFTFVTRHGRSAGTLVAVAFAFTLATAELAQAAKLAPIVGAFVAGVAMRQSHVAERVRRELTPVGHLFIPVFFLQIGIDADVAEFASGEVLRDAAVLLVIAILGKLASSLMLRAKDGDRWLIGAGMVPRGEVGLIFATIGLREQIIGADIYAALLLVVLLTTVLTPPVLRLRLSQLRRRRTLADAGLHDGREATLAVEPSPHGSTVELHGTPRASQTLMFTLDAATMAQDHRVGPDLLEWMGGLPDQPLAWDTDATNKLTGLLRNGGSRSWRLLWISGILDRALPELAEALRRRQHDLREFDTTGAFDWATVDEIRTQPGFEALDHPERALLAALITDAADSEDSAARVALANAVVERLQLSPAARRAITGLVRDVPLLPAAARADLVHEDNVVQLATHIGSNEAADALYLLTLARGGFEPWELTRLDLLHQLVRDTIEAEGLDDPNTLSMTDSRVRAAVDLVDDHAVRNRILAAPRSHVMRVTAGELVRHAALCEPPVKRHNVRVKVVPAEGKSWRVEFAARDRVGLVANETAILAQLGYDVIDATAVTWSDGCAVASFSVTGSSPPSSELLQSELEATLGLIPPVVAVDGVRTSFDNHASPWHTLCRIEAPDRRGLLASISAAFAASEVNVRNARITTVGDRAVDLFELTDSKGAKLSENEQQAIQSALLNGTAERKSKKLFSN